MRVTLFFFMIYGICELSVVPLRAEAKDQAEIVSQLLLGDLVEVVLIDFNWTQVRCLFDDYMGWLDTKQISTLSQLEFEKLKTSDKLYSQTHFTKVNLESSQSFAPYGSTFYKRGSQFLRFSPVANLDLMHTSISSAAKSFLNAPYLWGGKTIYGIDCSGFTQVVFKIFGIALKRDASQQVKQGENVDFKNVQENDLAFFSNPKGKVTHVGIILKDSKIIHASGKVRIDEFNEKGIFNQESNCLTHSYHSVRRYQGLLNE